MHYVRSFPLLVGLSLTFAGCQDTSSDDATAGEAEPTIESLAACVEDDFAPSPYMGPAFDPETGELLEALPSTYIAATTAGWVRPEEKHREALGEASGEVSGQVFESPGLLGVSFAGSEICDSARTLSLWADEASLMGFVMNSAHGEAMPLAATETLGWETTRWVETSEVPPTWDQARAALDDAR